MTILDLSKAISRKRCKIGGKLLLITNRKSHMRFQLVSKSVTLNGLECKPKNPVFTTLHAMQTRSSNENSVCLSARPSVCQTRDLSQNGKKDFYITRKLFIFILIFWLVGATPSTKNVSSTRPRWSDIANFQPIFARSSSAVTPTEKKSINTNRKSTTRFPMSLR